MSNSFEEIELVDFLNQRFKKEDFKKYDISLKSGKSEDYLFLSFDGYIFNLKIEREMSDELDEVELGWDFSFCPNYTYTDKEKSAYLIDHDCYYDDNLKIEFTLQAAKTQPPKFYHYWNTNIYHFDDNDNDIFISRMSQEMSFAFFESPEYKIYFENELLPILLYKIDSYEQDLFEDKNSIEASIENLNLHFDELMRSNTFTICLNFKDKKIINYQDENTFSRVVNKIEQVLYLAARNEEVVFFLNKKPYSPKKYMPFDFDEEQKENKIFPLLFDEKVFSYYKSASYTYLFSQKFMYYYQVMEYYFLRVKDGELLNLISQKISEESNSPNKIEAKKILEELHARYNLNDEKKMLKSVLKKYISESEAIEKISKYKLVEHVRDNSEFFKNPKEDHSLSIDNSVSRSLSNLSTIIYFLRCLLVHSSDKYNKLDCFLPFSESEKIIEPFIPIMKWLAEKIIEGSAQPIETWFE